MYAGTAITLSPSGTTSICPEGQVLLTCESISGFILYWTVSVPHLAGATTRQRIVPSQGGLVSPEFRIGFTEFSITRTSESPLISQMLINNLTIDTTVYCSEDGDINDARVTAINIIGSIPSKLLIFSIINFP